MAKDVKVGATTGDALAIVLGPFYQTADANLRHEGITTSSPGFELTFSTLGDAPLIQEAASVSELASWTHVGGGYYQVILAEARAAEARAGRSLIAICEGEDFYTSDSKEIGIVRHEPTALPWCNSSNEQQSVVVLKDGSLTGLKIGNLAIGNSHLADDLLAARNVADDTHTADHFAPAWFKAEGMAADTAVYQADIDVERDGTTKDEYTATILKNGATLPYASLAALPTITVIKRADGTTLINAQAMVRIGTTDEYKWDETTEAKLLAASETYLAYISFNDGTARSTRKRLIKVRTA